MAKYRTSGTAATRRFMGAAEAIWRKFLLRCHQRQNEDEELITLLAARDLLETDIFRHDFDKRELRVLMAVVRMTFAQGDILAWVPREKAWSVISGTDSNHIRDTINDLVARKILLEEKVTERVGADEKAYDEIRINHDAGCWREPKDRKDRKTPFILASREEVAAQFSRLKTGGGVSRQNELFEWAERAMKTAIANARTESFLDGASQASPETGEHNSNDRARIDASPEMGESLQNSFRPSHGNLSHSPETGEIAPVNTVNVQCLTAPQEEQLTAEQLTGGSALNRVKEDELLGRIADLVGDDDMRAWGGDWRKNWLRGGNFTALIRATGNVNIMHRVAEAVLNDIESRRREGWVPKKTFGASLKHYMRENANGLLVRAQMEVS